LHTEASCRPLAPRSFAPPNAAAVVAVVAAVLKRYPSARATPAVRHSPAYAASSQISEKPTSWPCKPDVVLALDTPLCELLKLRAKILPGSWVSRLEILLGVAVGLRHDSCVVFSARPALAAVRRHNPWDTDSHPLRGPFTGRRCWAQPPQRNGLPTDRGLSRLQRCSLPPITRDPPSPLKGSGTLPLSLPRLLFRHAHRAARL
jgi:hypothetical protein